MKAWYLLLGLMLLCAAGAGTVNSSDGYLADQNPTPFLIFGHVLYEDDSPCNSLIVNITNLGTGATQYADAVSGFNYYQTILRAADVNSGDVLRWSVTDGTVFDTANRTVGQSDLRSGGIFDFDVILQSIAPRIAGYAPESQIHNIENAARRFNVTIDQVVDVTWLINSSPAQTNESVTDASYTHTNVAIGVWNVSARASNANGTDMQEWIWNVTTLPPPVNRSRMLGYSSSNTTEPVLSMIYGWVFYENRSGCTGAVVNITNLNNIGMQWTAETHPGHYYYQLVLDAKSVSAGDVLLINASKDGVLINSTHNITHDEILDGAVMVDLNNGSIDLTVSEISPPLYFSAGRNHTIVAVIANNGTACTDGFEAALFVNGTPTGAVHVPSICPGGNWSVDFNWVPDHEGNHTIMVMADSGGVINETDESNNNRSAEVYVRFTDIDLVVMDNITLNKKPLDGDIIGVGVTIKNQGNDSAENFTVAFYDNDNAFHTEVTSLDAGDSDSLSVYWDASYGEHTIEAVIDPDGRIWEMDETNNKGSLSVSVNRSRDFAVTNLTFALDGMPCSQYELEWGMTVMVNATIEAVNLANHDCPVSVKFYRDAYGWYPIHSINETKLLFETGNSTQCVVVEWHIKDHYSIGDLHMTAIIDPDDEIHELNESNNEAVIPIHVKACDFTVTDITANVTPVTFGEIVELNATIRNLGDAAGRVDVAFMANSTDVPENRDISVSNVSVDAGGMAYATIHWNTSKTGLAGNCMITAVVDPDYRVQEVDEINNIFCGMEIFVDGTDLNVSDITAYSGDVEDGEDIYYIYGEDDLFNVTTTIENIGAIPAGEFAVEFYYNGSVFDRVNISGLGVDESCTVDTVWDLLDADIDDKQMLKVRIDGCDNPDNDLANNERVICDGEGMYVESPWDLTNASFEPDTDNPKEDEAVTITATVKNKGSRDWVTSVRFYLDDELFREKELYVTANSTNSTEVVWNPALLFVGPTNISKTHQIEVCAGRTDTADPVWKSVTVVPSDLTVNISLDSDYNMIVTARNNEDRTVNTTLWAYDVDHTVYTISESGSLRISNSDALNMSTHFFGEIDHTLTDAGYEVFDDYGNLLDNNIDRWGTGVDHTHYTPIDAWSRWGVGGNIVIKYWDIGKPNQEPGYATIEAGALINSMPVTLAAGETKNFTIEWNVTKRNHTLWAQLGGTNDSIDLNFDIDLAINVSMNDTVLDGDQETITADITNLGHGNASSFKVKFSNDTNLFHTEYVTHLDGNSTTTVTVVWTADTWNECEGKATSNHTIRLEIVPCGNTDINPSNNHINKIVRVSPTRDFSVTDITFVQDEVTEETTIDALIRNFGRAGSTSVSICVNNSTDTTLIYSGTHLIDSECYVNMTWNASMVGDCTINVTADPDDRTLETIESNNSMTLPVYIEAPDLTVESLMIDPIDLIEGDTTKITATVANIGDRDVDNVSVLFCDRVNYIRYENWRLDAGESLTITQPDAAGIRIHFRALKVPGNSNNMCIYDENGNQVIYMEGVGIPTPMWTDWVPGSSVTIKITGCSYAFAEIDRYDYHKIFSRTDLSLEANTSKVIYANWTAHPTGPHEVGVLIDPDDVILELNETDNELMNFIVVQGPDISVNLTLNNTNPVDGDIINITACIKNVGVLPANNFTAKVEIDEEVYANESRSLLPNELFYISTTWEATIGNHVIQVIADPDETIFETSEENNAVSINVFVNAPDLNATAIELNPADPVDGGETWMNATITNQGFQQANNFSADIFYEYGKFEGSLSCERYSVAGGDSWGERWVNLTWNNKTVDAGCIYIHIEEISGNPMLSVFDGNNTPITNSTTSRWIAVMENATNIRIYAGKQGHSRNSIALRFYAGNMTRFNGLTLDTNESVTLGMGQMVSTGSHDIKVFADSGNSVNENNKDNNIRKETAEVQPSRDFLVSYMSVSANGSPININNTPLDGDPVTVNVIVGNAGFRKGIVDIEIIDEHGWVDANPRYELTSYGYAYVIGYPGADAIRVHFSKLDVSPNNVVEIRDENGTLLCTISKSTSVSPWLDSDKIYVYRVMKPTAYGTYKYIACDIDMYQYRKINRTTVDLAANGTACIHARFNSSAGNHAIYVIADPDDKTGELDESNNEANETIYVKPCRDPAAVDLVFSPEMPYPGDAVDITATVTNNGNRTATFTVDLTALKSEYRPCESPHGSSLTRGFDEAITTYPEADWTGVHFTKISTVAGFAKTFLRIYGSDGNMSTYYYGFTGADIWEWVCGNVSRVAIPKLGESANIYGCSIDEVAHIVALNRTTVTLRPGETANITGILPNVRIGYRSISYAVTAMVDRDNTAFETDESNNAVSKVLTARCPDLTVGKNLHFTNDGKAKVVIKNIGTGKADDVEVSFGRDVEFSGRRRQGMRIPTKETDIDSGPTKETDIDSGTYAIRVHFKKLRIAGSDSLYIKKSGGSPVLQKYTRGDYSDSWSNWVDGTYLRIYRDRNVRFEVDRYEYAKDESVGDISGTKKEKIPWTGYDEPYNLTIYVDPGDDITESNEDNNNETIEMGTDISVTLKGSTIPDYLLVDHPINFIIPITNDGGTLPTPKKFNVTLYTDMADGEMVPVENHTIKMLNPRDYCHVWFEWEPPTDRLYRFIIRADPEDSVAELNEKNNELDFYVRVFPNLGYGGSSLETYTDGEVNGSFIFKMGDRVGKCSPDLWYEGEFPFKDSTYRAKWDILLPADASIEIGRLYLYWGHTDEYTQPTEFNVKFNDHLLTQEPRYPDYSDYPIEEGEAFGFNYAYGVYCYDVKDRITGSDDATVTIRNLHGAHDTCIAGMSLVIVYESDEGILTKYWINEGADVLGCGKDTKTPLSPDECTTELVFEGDADSDGLSNATLITVVPWGSSGREPVGDEIIYIDKKWAGKKRNGLYFNGKELKDGAYVCDPSWDSVGIDERDVKDDLVKRDNVAEIQDRGDSMMLSANGFLILRYPPDLSVINLTAPASTVVGAHHPINVTIRNDGKGSAHDFNLTLHIDGKQMVRIPHLDLPAGENMTIHLYNWTPMLLVHVYNLTAAADVLSGEDWTEIETDNNAMTKRVLIEEGGFGNQTGPRGIGGGSNPTGGEYTEKITGRVMQGMKEFLSFGGGGGAGMFSLTEWIMKGAVCLVLLLFVCIGYFMEQRSYEGCKVPYF